MQEILTFSRILESAEMDIKQSIWYHGSKKPGLVFDDPKTGGKRSDMQLDFGTHFSKTSEYASTYGEYVYKARLYPKKALDLVNPSRWVGDPGFDEITELFLKLKPGRMWDRLKSYYGKDGEKYDTVQLVAVTQNMLDSMPPQKVYNTLVNMGYDSVIYEVYHPDHNFGSRMVGRNVVDIGVVALTKDIIRPINK